MEKQQFKKNHTSQALPRMKLPNRITDNTEKKPQDREISFEKSKTSNSRKHGSAEFQKHPRVLNENSLIMYFSNYVVWH